MLYGHNDPMAVGAYLAAKELGREKEIAFIGVDGLDGEAGGVKKVQDGILAATFVYPLCVDKAVEVALKMLRDPSFKPEKDYDLPSKLVTRGTEIHPTFGNGKICYIEIPATDIERSAEFYGKVFGWRIRNAVTEARRLTMALAR